MGLGAARAVAVVARTVAEAPMAVVATVGAEAARAAGWEGRPRSKRTQWQKTPALQTTAAAAVVWVARVFVIRFQAALKTCRRSRTPLPAYHGIVAVVVVVVDRVGVIYGALARIAARSLRAAVKGRTSAAVAAAAGRRW